MLQHHLSLEKLSLAWRSQRHGLTIHLPCVLLWDVRCSDANSICYIFRQVSSSIQLFVLLLNASQSTLEQSICSLSRPMPSSCLTACSYSCFSCSCILRSSTYSWYDQVICVSFCQRSAVSLYGVFLTNVTSTTMQMGTLSCRSYSDMLDWVCLLVFSLSTLSLPAVSLLQSIPSSSLCSVFFNNHSSWMEFPTHQCVHSLSIYCRSFWVFCWGDHSNLTFEIYY